MLGIPPLASPELPELAMLDDADVMVITLLLIEADEADDEVRVVGTAAVLDSDAVELDEEEVMLNLSDWARIAELS